MWPGLFRAAGLSIRPGRVLLATLAALLMTLASRASTLWSTRQDPFSDLTDRMGALARETLRDAASADFAGALDALWVLFLAPGRTVAADPVAALILLPIALALAIVPFAAVARQNAVETAHSALLPIRDSISFASRRWPSLFGVFLLPALAIGTVLALLVGFGLLLAAPYLDILGGVLYVLALCLGLLGVAIIGLTALASPMLVPAVVCEGTDALDALQRSIAYVLLRPLRFLLYAGTLIVQGILLYLLASFVLDRVLWLTDATTTILPLDHAREVVAQARAGSGTGAPVASRAVSFWSEVVRVFLTGWALSYFAAAGTLLYLSMRRVCDGQDIEELWSPGMIEATMARAMRARADLASNATPDP